MKHKKTHRRLTRAIDRLCWLIYVSMIMSLLALLLDLHGVLSLIG